MMKCFLYSFCLLLLGGCTSLKQMQQSGKPVTQLSAFDGVYDNQSAADQKFSSLWGQLSLSQADTLKNMETRIMLSAIDHKRIKAKLIWKDQVQAELILKGKLKNNYFVSRCKRAAIPIPLIYGEFSNNQFQLSLTEDNTLHVDRLNNKWGWVFLFLASNESTVHLEYKRLKP